MHCNSCELRKFGKQNVAFMWSHVLANAAKHSVQIVCCQQIKKAAHFLPMFTVKTGYFLNKYKCERSQNSMFTKVAPSPNSNTYCYLCWKIKMFRHFYSPHFFMTTKVIQFANLLDFESFCHFFYFLQNYFLPK